MEIRDVPTPCSVPRRFGEGDIQGSDALQKRFRLDGDFRLGPYIAANDLLHRAHAERRAQTRHGASFLACADDDSEDDCSIENGLRSKGRRRWPGSEANVYLGLLHNERLFRRHQAMAASPGRRELVTSAVCDTPSMEGIARALETGTTSFSIADVVQCDHSPCGRCLRCCGRVVHNVSMAAYAAFCRAYSSSSSSQADEISFPALAALFAGLAPESGERLLHVGSGTGRAVTAFALLYPDCLASGVEGRVESHHAAVSAALRLDVTVQPHVHLHNCDPLQVRCAWKEATIILLSLPGFDDQAMSLVSEALRDVQVGTRVISLTQPLKGLPAGVLFAREGLYRTSAGNLSAFVYRKSPR